MSPSPEGWRPSLSTDARRTVAVIASIVAAFVMWVVGHRAAVAATRAGQPLPNALATLRAGWYEVITAGLALFIWATAMPGSWWDWGSNAVWLPAAVVALASILIGGIARLLNR